jgi:antitoxin MazE
MTTRIQKWGNSQGLRIPREVLEAAQVAIGDEVEISADGGRIIICPKRRIRGRYDLNELLARVPDGVEDGEVDWGKPRGREVW